MFKKIVLLIVLIVFCCSACSTSNEYKNVISDKPDIVVSEAQPTDQQTVYVWVAKTGKRYHKKSNCSNMKNPSYVSKAEAIEKGYTPCANCY